MGLPTSMLVDIV